MRNPVELAEEWANELFGKDGWEADVKEAFTERIESRDSEWIEWVSNNTISKRIEQLAIGRIKVEEAISEPAPTEEVPQQVEKAPEGTKKFECGCGKEGCK